MTLGEFGSTLNDELNRLANGGTYRTMGNMVDDALAAKQWANRENISPYSTDTVGILNEIAGLGLDKRNWLDFNGVCNYIAGTTGLPAAAALRQVYATTDLLTGVASYYVDAYDAQLRGGYLYLPGVAGNFASAPDAAALDITGDIDIRVKVALDDWTPSATNILIAKYDGGGTRSYGLQLNTNGTLTFFWSTDGSNTFTSASTVATGVIDGATKWVRATMDVDNGASGNTVTFFTSDDGSTWTQLGTTVTTAGTTSIFAGTALLRIGQLDISGSPARGKFYRAQVLNGIAGTTVFDANFETAMTSQTVASFTESSSNAATVTVNRNTYNFQLDTINNLGAAGSLLPTTLGSSTAADSNDPKFLDFTGTNYVYLPGSASNFLSVADSDALDITGDIDIRAQIAMDDWTQGAAGDYNFVVAKWTATNATRSYVLGLRGSGVLNLGWVETGGTNIRLVDSTVAPTISDGAPLWIRATLDVDNGSSQYEVKFFTSNNGTTWTQLGSTITGTTGISSIQATTTAIAIGSITGGASNLATSKVFRAQIFNGIDGTKVLDVDTSTLQTGADAYIVPVTYSGAAGARFTGSGLALNGVAGNYASTPDSSALDITGDIDLRVKVAMNDWTPAATSSLINKWQTSTTRSYSFYLKTDGKLELNWSNNGTAISGPVVSTIATGIADGTTKWVRATLDVDNGASGKTVKFFTSDDGTNWTQLGSDVTSAGTTSIHSGTSELAIGAVIAGTLEIANGTFYQAQVLNGIDGTVAFNANFEGVPADSLRMTESSSNAAVVTLNTTRYCTINRSTSGRKTVAVTQPTWLFGTDDYMEVNNRYMSSGTYLYLPGVAGNTANTPDSAALDITGDLDIRCKVALDGWTTGSDIEMVSKMDASFTVAGSAYRMFWRASTRQIFLAWSNSSALITTASTTGATVTDGSPIWLRATLDVDNGAGAYEVKFWTSDNGTTWTQLGTTVTGGTTTSVNVGNAVLTVGSTGAAASNNARGKFFRAQVLNGIDGTVAFDANFETSITSLNQASFTESSANAATVTINRSGSTYRSAGITTAGYLYPGATNTFTASATDFLNFGASDSFTLIAVTRQFATAATLGVFIAKRTARGWALQNHINTGEARFLINDGTNGPAAIAAYANGSLNTVIGIRNVTTDTLTITTNTASANTGDTTTSTLATLIDNVLIGRDSPGNNNNMELYAVAVFRSLLTTRQINQIVNYFARREAYL